MFLKYIYDGVYNTYGQRVIVRKYKSITYILYYNMYIL